MLRSHHWVDTYVSSLCLLVELRSLSSSKGPKCLYVYYHQWLSKAERMVNSSRSCPYIIRVIKRFRDPTFRLRSVSLTRWTWDDEHHHSWTNFLPGLPGFSWSPPQPSQRPEVWGMPSSWVCESWVAQEGCWMFTHSWSPLSQGLSLPLSTWKIWFHSGHSVRGFASSSCSTNQCPPHEVWYPEVYTFQR